ncbi:hypothetical protein SRABI106_01768 [Rahnella aquatilis]|nr:hypothetical protein SRABI106_01768 [Rahnella aquatilis]
MEIRPAQATDLRVGVREQSPLQQRIIGEIYARHNVPRVERGLLGFSKEIIGVTVEHHFADQFYRHQFFRDEFGRVEQVEIKFEFIFFRDQLHTQFVFRIISGFDGLPQITAVEIGIFPGQFLRFIP